jgi:proteasome accessory factor BC
LSHDTDKLIRQLSLVAFLMAERRPLTARDVKSCVEGYSEMSDEAFARRFYSDRAELSGLGVPLHSQRDEFTGEELYTLKADEYFLPPLELKNDEFAALQTCLYLLEGKFAYAEPLRLALQNLALGRPGFPDPPTEAAVRVEVSDPDYSVEMSGRLNKLESAISKQRTVKFRYWSISRDSEAERTLNPLVLLPENGVWYVVGEDVDDGRRKKFRVSRIRGEIRFATRRERDFKTPTDFNIDEYRARPPWQIGELVGEARIEVGDDTAWWVERAYGESGRVENGVFVTPYSNIGLLASWVLRQDGRAIPVEPVELRRQVADGLRTIRDRHTGKPLDPAAEAALPEDDGMPERLPGPVAPERFAVLQSLLAYLLKSCGDNTSVTIPAADLVERFHIPEDELQDHLSLLNLVNFGGGCYAVYAQLDGDTIRVDKEIWGDSFREPPRLTPLEARAIRLALEFVGPMIAAEAHTPLARVRKKLEDTFGEFDLTKTPEPHVDSAEEQLVATLSDAIRRRQLVAIEYLKEGEETPSTRLVEPYAIERSLPHWYVHTYDRTSRGERTFRIDRMREAERKKDTFEPRPGFEPTRLRDARRARIWYSPEVARWQVERDAAVPLVDGAALAETPVGSPEWLTGEVFSHLGEAVVLEPRDLRQGIAARARELARDLGVSRLRVSGAR